MTSQETTIAVGSDDDVCGVNMTTCKKCNVEYNACLPNPHVCFPGPPVQSVPIAKKVKQPTVDVAKPVVPQPCGVNMVKCSKCGQMKNACLPPHTHHCLVLRAIGPLGKADDDTNSVDTDELLRDIDIDDDAELNLSLSDDDDKDKEKKVEDAEKK